MVCVESLAVKNLLQNEHLAKAISDVGWGELLRQLEYKAVWYGRTVVATLRFYPSSKRCSVCGHILESLELDVRQWTCPECGAVHDRDTNAALNSKAAGLAVLACGEAVRPNLNGTREGTPQRSRKPSVRTLESPSCEANRERVNCRPVGSLPLLLRSATDPAGDRPVSADQRARAPAAAPDTQ